MGPQWRQSAVPSDGPDNHGAGAEEWWAVQVWTGRETVSAEHLQQRGYDVFLPYFVQVRRWSDRVKKVRRALFDGYLFCLSRAEATGKIITAPGVVRIVGSPLRPTPVPPEQIHALQRVVETRLSVEPWPFLQAGQRVRIEAGPLSGVEGLLVTVRDEQRLVVSVPMLQRSVAVEMPSAWVSVAPAARLRGALA